MDNTKKRMKWVFAWLLKWCLLTGLFLTAGAGCVSAGEMEAPSVRDLLQDRTRGFSVRASYCEGADGYEISWSLDPGFSGETTSRLEDGKRTAHVRGFQEGDTVYVRVRAVRNEGKKEE